MLRCLTTVHEILFTRVTAIYKRNIFNYCCHGLHQRQNLPSSQKFYSAHAYSHSQKSNVQHFNSIPQQCRNYGTSHKLENNILVGSTSGDNVCLHTYSRSQKSKDQPSNSINAHPSNSINAHPSRNYSTGRRVENSASSISDDKYSFLACSHSQESKYRFSSYVNTQQRSNYGTGPKTANNVTTTSDDHERKRVTITCRGVKQESGCSFHVSYVDHSREPQEDQPVVLGIHGTPGSLQDFIPMLKLLVEKGFRVVVPDYPGFGDTVAVSKNDYLHFTHTPEERADFAIKFMEAVGLSKVDLLIGHSSGGYPGTFLASQKPEIFNGLMLICPGTGHVSPIPIFPTWYVKFMLSFWDSGGFVRQIVEICTNIGMKFIPLPFRNAEDALIGARILIGVDNKQMPILAGLVADSPMPLTYIYCDGDPVLATRRSRQYAAMFGVDRHKTDVYDSDAKLVKTGCSSGGLLKKGVEFKRRTHFPPGHDDLCPIIVNELVTLYDATKCQANL